MSRFAYFLIGCAIVWLILYNAQPKPIFEVRITADGAEVVNGVVRREFLQAIRQIAEQNQLTRGRIQGFPAPAKSVRLRISKHVPPLVAQQIRNVHGVTA